MGDLILWVLCNGVMAMVMHVRYEMTLDSNFKALRFLFLISSAVAIVAWFLASTGACNC